MHHGVGGSCEFWPALGLRSWFGCTKSSFSEYMGVRDSAPVLVASARVEELGTVCDFDMP